MAREFTFSTLMPLIEAAKRYETKVATSPIPSVHDAMPATVHHTTSQGPERRKPKDIPPGELCSQYNKYSRAYCELPTGRCKKGFTHKCSECGNFKCKAV